MIKNNIGSSQVGAMACSNDGGIPQDRDPSQLSKLKFLKNIIILLLLILAYRNVMLELAEIASKWHSFGVAIGLMPTELATIETKCQKDPMRCLGEVINVWFDEERETLSWETICNALRSNLVQNNSLANKLSKYN